jgi:hypothetical protein
VNLPGKSRLTHPAGEAFDNDCGLLYLAAFVRERLRSGYVAATNGSELPRVATVPIARVQCAAWSRHKRGRDVRKFGRRSCRSRTFDIRLPTSPRVPASPRLRVSLSDRPPVCTFGLPGRRVAVSPRPGVSASTPCHAPNRCYPLRNLPTFVDGTFSCPGVMPCDIRAGAAYLVADSIMPAGHAAGLLFVPPFPR